MKKLLVLACVLHLALMPVVCTAGELVDIGGEGYDDPGLITDSDARYLEDRTTRQDIVDEVPEWRKNEPNRGPVDTKSRSKSRRHEGYKNKHKNEKRYKKSQKRAKKDQNS